MKQRTIKDIFTFLFSARVEYNQGCLAMSVWLLKGVVKARSMQHFSARRVVNHHSAQQAMAREHNSQKQSAQFVESPAKLPSDKTTSSRLTLTLMPYLQCFFLANAIPHIELAPATQANDEQNKVSSSYYILHMFSRFACKL